MVILSVITFFSHHAGLQGATLYYTAFSLISTFIQLQDLAQALVHKLSWSTWKKCFIFGWDATFNLSLSSSWYHLIQLLTGLLQLCMVCQTQRSCYTGATHQYLKPDAFLLGRSGLNKSALSPFPFWPVNMDLQLTAVWLPPMPFPGLSIPWHETYWWCDIPPKYSRHLPLTSPSLPKTSSVKKLLPGSVEPLSLFNCPNTTLSDSSITEKKSMGYSQLVQWKFHSTFLIWACRSERGKLVRVTPDKVEMPGSLWPSKHHKPPGFESYFPDTEPDSAASMNVSQLIKSCCHSADKYLRAAEIRW